MNNQRFWGGMGGTGPAGVYECRFKRLHERPQYTVHDARLVASWLNGEDVPLPTMSSREHDLWDPARPKELRGKPGPYPSWIVGRTRTE